MTKRIILQVDGGGIRGITPAIVLAEIEDRIRRKKNNNKLKIHENFQLCCGTSTGAIIAGMFWAGVDGASIRNFYLNDGVSLFRDSKNPFYTKIFKPKYNRDVFVEKIDDILKDILKTDNNPTIGDLHQHHQSIFMATAYNLCSLRTHFIKSDTQRDHKFKLRNVIAWSALSAAYYFGKIDAPDYEWEYINADPHPTGSYFQLPKKRGAVFQDGGQGTQNCTLGYVLTEILSRGWDHDSEVVIISLGTGNKTGIEEYDAMRKIKDSVQAVKYLTGQARKEATPIQNLAAQYIAKHNSNIKIFRLDYESDKEYDLDDLNHISRYEEGADRIIKSSLFDELISEI